MIGINNGDISNTYATGSVSGISNLGGLIGDNSSGMTVDNSFWDSTVNAVGIGSDLSPGDTAGATGMVSADMMTQATFSDAGWDIANTGGSGAVWRIYEGSTTPWLTWWLKPVTVTLNSDTQTYSGAPYSGGNGYAVGNPAPSLSGTVGSPNPALSGTLAYGGTSQSAVNAGSYTLGASGLYSIQQGYDISYVDNTLTVNKANLTVTADNKNRLYGGVNPILTSTVSGFVNNETASTAAGFGGAANATTTANATTPVGTAVITAGAGNLAATNYAFTNLVDGTLTITPAAPTINPNAPPVNFATPPAPVLNTMAQLQSEALFYRMNNEPQTLNLSPTLTVTQSAGTGSAASSSESVNPVAGSTRMNVNTLMNVNTIVMGPSLQIMNIGATGTTLKIVNGGMRLPDTLANEN